MPDAPDELKEAVRLFPAVKVVVKFHLGLLIPFLALFALLFGLYGFAVFLLSTFLGISLIASALKDWRESRRFRVMNLGEPERSSVHQIKNQIWNILALPGQSLDMVLDRLAEDLAVRISSSTRKVTLSPQIFQASANQAGGRDGMEVQRWKGGRGR